MGKSVTSGVALAVLLTTLVSMSAGYLVTNDKDFLMYFDQTDVTIRTKDAKDTEIVTYAPSAAGDKNISYSVDGDSKTITADMTYWPNGKITAFNLKMTFKQASNGYWSMNEAVTTIEGLADPLRNVLLLQQIKLEAPNQRSFHCSNYGSLSPSFATKQGNHSISISFKGLQVEAFKQKNAGTFSEPWDCVGFFSIGIWSGIFIVAILIGILTWGLAMIMDVKTMDRFDDPKGKTVSFGTGD